MVRLDATDTRILQILQIDSSQSLAEISAQIHLSQNACWNRIKHLEQEGVIRQRVAILDPVKVGAGLTVFVMIRAGEHSQEWIEKFSATIVSMPEAMEFHRTGGEIDYLLKLQVASVAQYDDLYKNLIRAARCADVSAVFSMETLKYTTAVPVAVPARV